MSAPDDDLTASKVRERAGEIADRLDRLIKAENERREARGEAHITHREIAKKTGGRVSHSTVRSVHLAENGRGAPVNPQVTTLDAIGEVFGIRNGAEYFLSQAAADVVDAQLKSLHALAAIKGDGEHEPGDPGLSLAFRVAQLGPTSYQVVSKLADRLLAIELNARQGPDKTGRQDQ
ncbi:multiprotein-bridging factor 1 family protein [Kitasatospora sp. NPDC088548]|uniref:helix-turn-helix domain-containing protein n=1 Tax=Kitasatospora sp. NPDC088548 TaxID=3364075 RepID=UPI0037F27ADB